MVGLVCVCVFFVLLVVFTAFSLLGANHFLFGIYIPWQALAPLGLQLSAGLQPPRPTACWCFGWSLGMKIPPFRPQPRVKESFPPFSAVLLQYLG